MIYAVRNQNGTWTGATYPTLLPDAALYHASMGQQIVAVAGLVEVDGVFSEAPCDLATTRIVAVQRVRDWIGAFVATFTDGVPEAEVASWSAKATAARLHFGGDPQAMILAEAGVTGEDPDALAAKIMAKEELYTTIIAKTTGLRRATFEAIAAAKTAKAVDAAVKQSLSTATAMMVELGLIPSPAT
ncbi:MAG: hypothetical protein RL299_2130 [Pseudomonadota bacterium]|jgi:hypothetical protein